MTGTGIQADPFRPTNWDEFVTAVEASGAYVECPENAVWDMNDMYPEGIPTTANISCAICNGNGLVIRNLRHDIVVINFAPTPSVPNTIINNITFENVYGSNSFYTYSSSTSKTIAFNKCVFSGINTGSNYVFSGYANSGRNTIFTQCGFTLEAMNAGLFSGYYEKSCLVRDSHIVFKGKSLSFVTHTPSFRLVLENCFIEGEFQNAYLIGGNYNIFNCKCNTWTDYGSGNYNIINLDTSSNYPSNWKAVTTEQLKDAPYLRSLGFPIGVK